MLHELKVLSEQDVPRTTHTAQALVGDVPEGFGRSYNASTAQRHVLDDGFGRRHTYLRISLVEQCNLRCRYCMPEDGLDWSPNEALLTDEEVLRIARLFVDAGVTKIRLTGGEPLLRPGVERLTGQLGALPGLQTLAITTNGLLLPKKLPRLQDAGLNLLTISLDTLRPERFEAITRRRGFAVVVRAIRMAVAYGYDPVKINVVVMAGQNDDELLDFVAWTEHQPVEVRFIEFMPFDGNRWDDTRLVRYDEMLRRIRSRFPIERLQDGPNDTSKTYKVPGFRGQIGFITSMSEPFCEGCNRLRVTADGNLKVCLFGNAEVSLRDALRAGATDGDLRELVSAAIGRKRARHAGMHALADLPNRPMITIGG